LDRIINDRLEGYGYVSQPEGHNIVLEVPVISAKCYLLFVSLLNIDIGVYSRKIKVYKDIYAY
jgi:hypothetical protein